MHANRITHHPTRLAIAGLALGLLLTGCGKQDLYDPPGSPYEIVGHLRLPSANEGLDVIGRTVYVAGGEAGLHTIDWSDPANPVLLATINTTKFAEDVQVVRTFDGGVLRDIAHVVEGTEGVTSFDVTDPANPVDYNTGTTAVVGRTIFIEQDDDPGEPYRVYLAEDWKGVRIFESVIGDPGILAYNGVFVGTNGNAYGIVVRDGWGYTADNEMGLCVLDLRVLDLNAVTLSSWADTPGSARFVALQDDYALVADGVEGMAAFRIDGGETPVKVAQYDLSGFSESIALRDGLMALAGNLGGVHFMDVSDPEDPIYVGSTETPNATDVVFTEDGFCLVMDEEAGFYVLAGHGPFTDIADPAPVTDLDADPVGVGSIDLLWTMTGDDRFEGRAEGLEIRWSPDAIETEDDWDAAAPIPNTPPADEPGTSMRFTVDGLERASSYHFAVRTIDEAGRMSPLADDVEATTLDGMVLRDGGVNIEGGSVDDLYVFSVELLWGLPVTTAEVVIDGEPHAMSSDDGRHYTYETNLEPGIHDYLFRFEAASSDPVQYPASGEPVVGPAVGAVFTMGSPPTEVGRDDDEVQHLVALSRFVVAEPYEVTQAEWDAVMPADSNPSQHVGADRPVDSVTWFEAVTYCNARSDADGYTPVYTIDGTSVTADPLADGWRLPTEAEWEYLCRAGTESAHPTGELVELNCRLDPTLAAQAWYCANAATGPEVGGQKDPNPDGLYDMLGNLREWCWDWYGPLGEDVVVDPTGPASGEQRVVRGGSWYNIAQECRSAAREALPPDSRDDTMGLRVVRTDFSE
ncbi:SUMF1/EgtB/PvdO family nonheme iron enzyme [bacterium]|nr:SUMF1/EgtB/PvdO family nonheme iron enzyme [bacterium]